MSSLFTNSFYYDYLDHIDEDIDRKKFYDYLEIFNVNLKEIFPMSGEVDIVNKQRFNFVLRKLRKNFDVKIIESINFIEQDFVDMKAIIEMLDDKSWSFIKDELSVKYGKTLKSARILKFLV